MVPGGFKRAPLRFWFRGLGLAALSGARTGLGPALLVRRGKWTRRARRLAPVLAAVELIADKLPWIPDRTAPLPLFGRAFAGAKLVVACRPRRARRARWSTRGAALLGATVAIGSAVATFRLRRALGRALGGRALGNAAGGAIEDGVLLGVGAGLLRYT